jgi:hypothetical protein
MVSDPVVHLVYIYWAALLNSESTLRTPPSRASAFPLAGLGPGSNILTPPPFGHATVIDRPSVVFGNNCISNVVFSVIDVEAVFKPPGASFWELNPYTILMAILAF